MLTEDHVLQIFSEAMMVAFKMAAPMLLISLMVGLVIAILQAATQIHEQTLTFVPKLFAIVLVLFFSAPWLYATMRDFFGVIMETIATIV